MKLLLSAPIGCPGALSALRNHQGILSSVFNVDLVPLEELLLPSYIKTANYRLLHVRILRRLKMISVEKILPYGDNVILASFGPIYETIITKLNKKGIRPSFIWCSSLGQLEMTPGERQAFVKMIDYFKKGKIKYFLMHRRLYDSLGYFIKDATFLPLSIDLKPYQNIVKKDLSGINVDLFCRPRFGKNILNQILAFKISEISGKMHINFDATQYHGIIETISSEIVCHKWVPLEEYYSMIAAMDASLQVTIGESFNYAVCERMALGVPVLTTPDIYLVSEDPVLSTRLCVSAPDTPQEIAEMLKKMINDKSLRNDTAERCRARITEVANENNKIVAEKITTLFK